MILLGLGVQPPAPAAEDEAPPPAAFLEFLGEWEDEQGGWRDPLDYEGPQWQVLDENEGQHDE